ncbi:MAG TPA: hypothetical protein VGI30_11405, partial [Caulobacteraceae bacterium]
MTGPIVSRRAALAGAASLGISLDLIASGALADNAQGARSRKLVVIVCRGGLDGLSLSPPVGDPDYAGLRGAIA